MANNIAPSSLPVCHTFDEAAAQDAKANGERQALVNENEQLLQVFGMEEAQRKANEQEQAAVDQLLKEKKEEYDVEVILPFTWF